MERLLWEILVPTSSPGKTFSYGHHKTWDHKVRAISGGLTILKTAKGEWISTNGELVEDKIILVRIACSEEEIQKIMQITLEHYEQEAVMTYLVSTRVLMVEREAS